jgi:UDP-N-acetylglucosamine 4,6-dehydratase
LKRVFLNLLIGIKDITMINNKTIFITGGTGSFGKFFTDYILKNYKPKKIIIFSRDELKQHEMSQKYENEKKLRFFLGDVRDQARLEMATEGVDILVHAAAMKQVPASEYNPMEAINTNINGAKNVVMASIKNKIKQNILLSTDKACSPVNLYGATKLCAEKIFISAKNLVGAKKLNFSVLRYGNVNGSRGSVMPIFKKNNIQNKELNITDERMTRFSIPLQDAIGMVLWGIKNFQGGEILIPKIPSYRVIDLANSFKNPKIKFSSIRPGEKIHEDLISLSESQNMIDIGKYYILFNEDNKKKILNGYKKLKHKIIKKQFNYRSDLNSNFLSKKQLQKIVAKLPND